MQGETKTSIPLHRPGLKESFFFFLSGIISSVPFTLVTEQFTVSLAATLPQLDALLLSAVIAAPILEEFAKAFPLLYRHGETERSIFSLGFLTGLGFGIFEFITYVFLLGAPVFLRLPGVVFHGASTSITAYGIATKRALAFYLVAVGLHLSNNFAALLYDTMNSSALLGLWSVFSLFATVVTYVLSWRLYGKTSDRVVQ
jgi:RsiW-degrading membrane proteinase PrsW (M82 family)